ncbi:MULTISPECIES: FecR family protein [unclassified Acinetobacter]|uniref:FecR family protein n=1 Tax=unclassified Acinetobacter TaxID=196816 RepID=UPI0029351442|nr:MULTISPECIES: FecR domain-containing protein [unclassified Acinetobacter]WOE32638.1 FecR domain-containing protein [Acinetobacter sp. SAAs470]WOE38114.1 FecR domain-containing protein [Acinetobacter sp. SAAs474]
MAFKHEHKIVDTQCLQDTQRKLASFEDDILPYLPSKDAILVRAKQRQLKKRALTAAVLSIVAIGMAIFYANPVYQQLSVQTVKGGQKIWTLHDGSKIHLNTETKIHVLQRLRSQEILLQQGEASFQVNHSKYKFFQYFNRTFKVIAGEMEIVDIGTVFHVLKHNTTDATVAVETGEIAVKIGGSSAVMLHLIQGQSIRNHQQYLGKVSSVNLHEIKAWQSGEIVFNQMPLIKAIENFQRYADFSVQIENSELQHLQITGQFKITNYQKFMQILPILTAVSVEKISDKKWIIRKNNS